MNELQTSGEESVAAPGYIFREVSKKIHFGLKKKRKVNLAVYVISLLKFFS